MVEHMKINAPDFILKISPYRPGKPLEELEREYGISNSIKLASNENPLGPSPKAAAAMAAAIQNLHRYPDGSGYYLVRKLAEKLKVSWERLVLGNGSDDVIGLLTRAFLVPGDEAVMPVPAFLMYEIFVRSVGAAPVMVPLRNHGIDLEAMLEKITDKTRMVFLTQPNNPTGTAISKADFEKFLKLAPPNLMIIVDEAYIEFMRDPQGLESLAYIDKDDRVVTLRTFSKAYGLAGIRIGYGVMAAEIAKILQRIRQPFNANSLAQVAAVAALDDQAFLQKTIAVVHQGLDFLYAEMQRLHIPFHPSQANFFMIDLGRPADEVFEKMLLQGVIVRSMSSYGYPTCIRVSVGLPEENVRFVQALEKVLAMAGT